MGPIEGSHCSLCCHTCRTASSHCPGSSKNASFSLPTLFAAGTIELPITTTLHLSCTHEHASDNWHYFDGLGSSFLGQPEAEVLEQLSWLIAERFVSVTCYSLPGKLVLRIYLVPYDLPGFKGTLSRKQRSRESLSRARVCMGNILPRVVQDLHQWETGESEVDGTRRYLLNTIPDSRTLSKIYEDLPSPQPQIDDPHNSFTRRLLNFDDDLSGLGLSSTLHQYQRRSVATMIQMENEDRTVPDPLYIPLVDMNGRKFYYQPGTAEILSSVSFITSRGGVLCEELGTGKTVMVLALVMSNLRSLSSPPSSAGERPATLTPLSSRFQPEHHLESSRVRHSSKPKASYPLPSLREVLVDMLSRRPHDTVPDTTTVKGQLKDEKHRHLVDIVEQLPTRYLDWVGANVPFYVKDKADLTDARITGRTNSSAAKCGSRAMYLTSATLIIVPANILTQWHREIQKHCGVSPRVFIARNKKELPAARELATAYDIVLMTYPRFSEEYDRRDVKACKYKPCQCSEFPGSRLPNCKCTSPNISPLLEIHWKRLVIDEGHVSASLSTRVTPFAKLLSVDSRWIVTGTPTTNLLGLGFGSQPEESATDIDMAESSSSAFQVPDDGDAADSDDVESNHTHVRVWTEADDIQRLLNMLVHFVGMKYLADTRMVKACIKEALLDPKGPRPGAIKMFIQLMSTTMVRHRIEDVEREAILPKLSHESVLLDLDPYAVKSYNALQAAIAINAVDSERQDEDYMFHHKNNEFLQITVKNMSQLLFWSIDKELYNVVELQKTSQKTLEHLRSKPHIPESDIKLAEEAFSHVQAACDDALWRKMQTYEDVPFRVLNVSPAMFESWSLLSGLANHAPTFMHPDHLFHLRTLAFKHPLKSEDILAALGREYAREQMLRRMEYERRTEKKEKGSRGKHQLEAVHLAKNNNEKKLADASKTDTSNAIIKEMEAELRSSLNRLELDEDVDMGDAPHALASRNAEANAAMDKRLANPSIFPIRVSSSASSKLNYIIDDVLRYSPNEKFLIFSESELTLAHIAEGLLLAGVKFLRFTTQVPQQVREQFVLTFETSDLYRVFLMELKHGARGLNLVTASRVMFCEPVWQADVESQAIKRAHRIGQTRPVHVKTLAIRGTAEEKMLEWKRTHKQPRGSKVPKLPLEEVEIRHFIANPKFLSTNNCDSNMPFLDIPLLTCARPAERVVSGIKKPTIRIPPQPVEPNAGLTGSPGSGQKRPQSQGAQETSPPKKRKIMFVV